MQKGTKREKVCINNTLEKCVWTYLKPLQAVMEIV